MGDVKVDREVAAAQRVNWTFVSDDAPKRGSVDQQGKVTMEMQNVM